MSGRPNGERHICAATANLPLRTMVLVLDIVPDEDVHPMEIVTGLRCGLEAHTSGPHGDLVRELNDASRGEVWVLWECGREPDVVAVLPDCPAVNTLPGAEVDACTLFDSHPGGHCFEFSDPEYDAIRASPAYDRLQAEWDERLSVSRRDDGE
ncbi:hypothetical protein ACFYT4_11440 [Streptomyces sp. NPDC004609]|uniref:hypothetical protein n=1 Tax=Streptomyces sp. NPDC004609 TaxID=3364704 RepID=UPI0036C55BF8